MNRYKFKDNTFLLVDRVKKNHVGCLTVLLTFDVVTYCDANDSYCHLSHALLSSICATRHGTLYFLDSIAISSCQNHNRIRHIQWPHPVTACLYSPLGKYYDRRFVAWV